MAPGAGPPGVGDAAGAGPPGVGRGGRRRTARRRAGTRRGRRPAWPFQRPRGALPEEFELAGHLLRAGRPAACRQAAGVPAPGWLPAAVLAWFELAARLERRPVAAAIAWCPRAAAAREARSSAGVQQADARRSRRLRRRRWRCCAGRRRGRGTRSGRRRRRRRGPRRRRWCGSRRRRRCYARRRGRWRRSRPGRWRCRRRRRRGWCCAVQAAAEAAGGARAGAAAVQQQAVAARAGRGAAAGGAGLGGALGFPSGPSSSLACATTIGAVCACDEGAANCIAVSAVVASSTRRRFVMMVWILGVMANKIGNQRISVGPDCGGLQWRAAFISTRTASEGAIIHCAFRRSIVNAMRVTSFPANPIHPDSHRAATESAVAGLGVVLAVLAPATPREFAPATPPAAAARRARASAAARQAADFPAGFPAAARSVVRA